MKIGVLALQGDYQAHIEMLKSCSDELSTPLQVLAVRDAESLRELDGLVIPGGESTTMSRLCDRYDLWPALHAASERGVAMFGTCAGLILMAKNLSGGAQTFQQKTLGVLDVDVVRNGYGRQLDSFETELDVPVLPQSAAQGNQSLHAVFIRAPRLERVGSAVQVLAAHNGEAVAVCQGAHLGSAFHPEISGDARLHLWWLREIENRQTGAENLENGRASTCTEDAVASSGSQR